jgi:hypothetical protein
LYFSVYNKRIRVTLRSFLQALLLALALQASAAVGAPGPGLTVFAAASLQNALEAIDAARLCGELDPRAADRARRAGRRLRFRGP